MAINVAVQLVILVAFPGKTMVLGCDTTDVDNIVRQIEPFNALTAVIAGGTKHRINTDHVSLSRESSARSCCRLYQGVYNLR